MINKKESEGAFWSLFCVALGALGIWSSLVNLETHHDPIFGSWNTEGAEWAAVSVIIGLIFLILGLIGIYDVAKRADKDKDNDDSN